MSDKISPWQHEPNAERIAKLGKLAEEASELAARAARCIIQGYEEVDPDRNQYNYELLDEEIADVEACITALRVTDRARPMPERYQRKLAGFFHWFTLIK